MIVALLNQKGGVTIAVMLRELLVREFPSAEGEQP